MFGLHGIFLLGALRCSARRCPVGYVWRKGKKRLTAFDEQLPDLLMAVAASLKAGHSFKQGIQTLVDEAQDPAKKEFQRVLAEASLGRPIEHALADMAERLGSKNFSFIVTAVTIQNQVGGSLAGLFDMVADTVRQRQQFSRKIKALTAMGRASAYVLIALPIFLAMLLTVINHKYMAPLFFTSAGHTLIIDRPRDRWRSARSSSARSSPSRGNPMILLVLAIICLCGAVFLIGQLVTLPAQERAALHQARRRVTAARAASGDPRRDRGEPEGRACGAPVIERFARLVLRINPKTTIDGVAYKLVSAGRQPQDLADDLPRAARASSRSRSALFGLAARVVDEPADDHRDGRRRSARSASSARTTSSTRRSGRGRSGSARSSRTRSTCSPSASRPASGSTAPSPS